MHAVVGAVVLIDGGVTSVEARMWTVGARVIGRWTCACCLLSYSIQVTAANYVCMYMYYSYVYRRYVWLWPVVSLKNGHMYY